MGNGFTTISRIRIQSFFLRRITMASSDASEDDARVSKIAESPGDPLAAEHLCEKNMKKRCLEMGHTLKMDEHGNFQKMIRD